MDEFKSQIPDLAQSLREHIAEAHQKNKRFRDAFALFVALRRVSLSPGAFPGQSGRYADPASAHRASDAQPFPKPRVHYAQRYRGPGAERNQALASGSFSTAEFLKRLDPYYKAIERAGAGLSHFTEKQDFLNSGSTLSIELIW
jgi:hypothetical protein